MIAINIDIISKYELKAVMSHCDFGHSWKRYFFPILAIKSLNLNGFWNFKNYFKNYFVCNGKNSYSKYEKVTISLYIKYS